MATYGFKTSLPGTPATSTEPRDFSFSTDYSTVKVYSENAGTLGVPASGSAFATITHGLGYVPMVIPYIEATSNQWTCGIGYTGVGNTHISNKNSSVGTGNLVLNIKNDTAGSLDVKYKCYIMGDSGN